MSREEEDKRAKDRSRRPRKPSGSGDTNKDRDAKAKARRERNRDKGDEVKPGAVSSSSNDHSESRESRKTRRHDGSGTASTSKSSTSRSSGNNRDADREAKRTAKLRSDGSSSTPGASRSGNGSDREAKRKAKMGSSGASAGTSRSSSERERKTRAKSRSGDNKDEENAIQVDKAGPNGEVQLEAVAVGDDLENQELKKKEAEIERLKRQMETMANQQQPTEDQSGENEEMATDDDSSSSNKWKIICVILVLLAIAGGVAGYFATQGSPAESPQVQENPATPAPTAPTIDTSVYPAPNEEDCKAIESGSTVQGQDDLFTSEFIIDIDSTLAFGMDEESWLSVLNDSLQSKLFPVAAGCSVPIARRLAAERRDLQQSSLPNFVIANGKVVESTVVAGECRDDTSENCFRVNVTLLLWLRDPDTNLLYVVGHLVDTLGDSPVDFLDLRTLMSNLVVVSGRSISPTDPPSWSPSLNPTMEQPSLSPTDTEAGSSRPSFAPIVGPTTSRPTQAPTEAPIVSPTATPVVAPVVPVTTENPTTSPTAAPVVVPTLAPVVGPSPPPTQFPSNSPSHSPSSAPSSSPSSFPTQPPSGAPSASPSASPSSSPSSSPSGRPSNRPSLIESDPPTVTLPLWEFQISIGHSSSTCEGTGGTVIIDMYSDVGLVESFTFANGIGFSGATVSANAAPDVTRVTVSINSVDAMFIDVAELSKDGVSVKKWGSTEGLDGYCLSTDPGDSFPISTGSGSTTVACHASHDFQVVEPLWEFEIFIDNFYVNTREDTEDTITVDMYGDHGLVKSFSFSDGIDSPGAIVSANGPDVSKVTLSTDGDDELFIDYAVLSKDGVSIMQWGTDDGADGYCLSTQGSDNFLVRVFLSRTTVRCERILDFEVV